MLILFKFVEIQLTILFCFFCLLKKVTRGIILHFHKSNFFMKVRFRCVMGKSFLATSGTIIHVYLLEKMTLFRGPLKKQLTEVGKKASGVQLNFHR